MLPAPRKTDEPPTNRGGVKMALFYRLQQNISGELHVI